MLSSAFVTCALVLLVIELKTNVKGATLSPQDLVMMVNHDGAVMIDTRALELYNSGHILNSIHIPQDDIDTKLNTLGKYKNKTVVVICQSGMKGQKVAAILTKAGYTVKQLAGGIEAYKTAGLPLVKTK